MCRYLRASNWKLDTAITRIENTLNWRREYGLYDILNAKLVEPEVRYYSDIVNASLQCLLQTFRLLLGNRLPSASTPRGSQPFT